MITQIWARLSPSLSNFVTDDLCDFDKKTDYRHGEYKYHVEFERCLIQISEYLPPSLDDQQLGLCGRFIRV